MTCGGRFDLARRETDIKKLEELSAGGAFWDDQQQAQKLLKQLSEHRSWVEAYRTTERALGDLGGSGRNGRGRRRPPLPTANSTRNTRRTNKLFENLELRAMLTGKDDALNAIVHIHPGAGGTESNDWAGMLYRMYLRWFEQRGWKTDLLDLEEAEEAGIRAATIEVVGEYAYGFCRAESGVHRLVRISPVRFQRPPPHLLCQRLRLSRSRRRAGNRNQARRFEDRHLPRQRRGRAARQPHGIRDPHHPLAHQHRRHLPDRPQPAPQPRQRHEGA